MATITTEIKRSKSKVFRRLYIKRRLASTGLFESSWVDVTKDVKSWGRISKSIDYVRYSKVRFSDVNVIMANDYGKYNPEDDEASFWFGFASQQRTLVKIESGFTHQTQSAGGVWTNTEVPSSPITFVGVVQGDISLSDENQVVFTVKPLLQVFRDFSTRNLTGYTTTGMTAKQFLTMLRDQTDGAANFIFRPFFKDTTTMWNLTSSAISYVDIANTVGSRRPVPAGTEEPQNDFIEMNVWDAIEKLAEAENLVPYITRDGMFNFSDRDPNTTTAAFEFFGRGFNDMDYGITIKRVNRYVKKVSDYYSRVEVKWLDSATTTAVVTTQTSMAVNGTNSAWLYGHRTFKVENYWIGTLTSAQTLANNIFQAVSSINSELDFTTSFVPHLELLDRIKVSYESSEQALNSRWDIADWADESGSASDNDLIWDNPVGDAIRFADKEFKLVSIELNLDNFESRFVGIAL
jgi:hypothetical protein